MKAFSATAHPLPMPVLKLMIRTAQAAAEVAKCLREHGWELASHSWGHLDLGTVEWDRFQSDTDKWESEVESLIGPTDIILFPLGQI